MSAPVVSTTEPALLAGRYRLSVQLGEGGMGQVWSATQLKTGKPVAIKRLLLPHTGAHQRDARARFLLEARSICAVNHPNVVEVFDFVDEEPEPPFIVMELLSGETLAEKLARSPVLPLAEVARILSPVVSAVGTAHARGIVHRDLKPSNIFLSMKREGAPPLVKVLDFGIAKWLRSDPLESGLRTQTGSTLGTPSYMSPEQATAERDVDHRSDIWSLGVIIYECLSGARPVEGENAAQMVMRLLSSGIIPIEHLVPSLPVEFSALLGRMLSRQPAQRPEDLRELFEVLRDIAGDDAPSFGAPAPALQVETAAAEAPSLRVEARSGVTADSTWERRAPSTPAGAEPSESARAAAVAGKRRLQMRVALVLLLAAGAFGFSRFARQTRPATPSAGAAEAAQPLPPPEAPPVPVAAVAAATSAVTAPAASIPEPPSPAAPRSVPPSQVAQPSKAGSKPNARPSAPLPKPEAQVPSGRPRGAECERSSECASRLCVALACE